MSNIYEIRLREEFKLLRKLQNYKPVSKYLTIQYRDRVTRKLKPINAEPDVANRYPETFKVTYKMPVYINEREKDKNWQGTFEFTVSESIILNMNIGGDKPYAIFRSGRNTPFNNHINGNAICDGNAWDVRRQSGYGLWFYVIAVGMLINQDEFVTATNGVHLNGAAFEHWKRRRMKPVTNIKWPMILDQMATLSPVTDKADTKKAKNQKSAFKIKDASKKKKPAFKIS